MHIHIQVKSLFTFYKFIYSNLFFCFFFLSFINSFAFTLYTHVHILLQIIILFVYNANPWKTTHHNEIFIKARHITWCPEYDKKWCLVVRPYFKSLWNLVPMPLTSSLTKSVRYWSVPIYRMEHLGSVIVKVQDCNLEVSEFKFQSCYNVLFLTNTLGEVMNPNIPPSYNLNSTNTVLLQGCFEH